MTKQQAVTKILKEFNNQNGVIEYQLLFITLADYIASDEVKDISNRMFIGHMLESFLRNQNLQRILTIQDLNVLFNPETLKEQIDNVEIYKTMLLLLYEELSSNNNEISFKVQETVAQLCVLLNEKFSDENITIESTPVEATKPEESVRFFEPVVDTIDPNTAYLDQNRMPEEESAPNCVECDKKYTCTKPEKTFVPTEEIISQDINVYDIPSLTNEIPFNNKNKTFIAECLKVKKMIPYKCAICGLDTWQNNPLPLKLQIKDMNSTVLSNYRFLCPNCYSQLGDDE